MLICISQNADSSVAPEIGAKVEQLGQMMS